MEVGMIGLGRMGGNMTIRLLRDGHRVVAYDRSAAALQAAGEAGAECVTTLEALTQRLTPPRAIWLMIPAGAPVDDTIAHLLPLLQRGDLLIDGGNSNYRDSQRRAAQLAEHGIGFVDVGTSGGIWGLSEGYCLMVGGTAAEVARIEPVLRSLAPAGGYAHVGPCGAGHYVKMIHNGIEYGLMQAYAEGFELLHAKREFNLDLAQIAALWLHGSVVRSWLLELAARMFAAEGDLATIRDWVADSGEGRWTVQEAIELAVPAPVIALALMQRFASRQEASFAAKVVAGLRHQFGGHSLQRAEEPRQTDG